MKIVWDECERLVNIVRHGFDFAALKEDSFLQSIIVPASHGGQMAIGRLDDGTIAVILVYLGTEGISVISMRVAGARERMVLE